MATLALVHGAWFGGWCWDRLAGILRQGGHTVVAPDLPIDDPNAGIADYAATVVRALEKAEREAQEAREAREAAGGAAAPASAGGASDVILVGHSMGGLVIPVVAEQRPVAGLIFMNAYLPELDADAPADPDMDAPGWQERLAKTIRDDDGATTWPQEAAIEVFFHDCPRSFVGGAAKLLRSQAGPPPGDRSPLQALPTAPAAYVLCTEDRVVNPAWSRRVARKRLGTDAIELPGGHCPMLADPDLMADLLDQMAGGLAQLRGDSPPPAPPQDPSADRDQ